MSEKGFVKIDRAIFDHWLFDDKPFCRLAAWIDLICLANHKTTKRIKNGRMTTFKRGTVNRSILELSERWGWDRKKVRNFLKCLEADQMVTFFSSRNGTTKGTTIKIVNYDKFQSIGTTKGTSNSPSNGTTTPQQMGQQLPINKNEKNEKNEKDVYGAAAHTFPPTLSEVSDYIAERGLRVTAEKFWRYYEAKEWTLANGRRMTRAADWHGALESWKEDDGDRPAAKARETYQPFDYERKGNDLDTVQRELARQSRIAAKGGG